MSGINDDIRAAITESCEILAEVTGMDADAGTNSLYNGGNYLAVYGQPEVQREMLTSGGYKQRTLVPATATRAQFDAPPVANGQWVRTDMTPQITYRIMTVSLHDPFVFVLTLARFGEVT